MDKTPQLLLRIGIAFAFLYPPVSAFITPLAWIGFFPPFMSMIPLESTTLLHLFGVVEVIVGLWILSGKNIAIPSAVAGVMLFLIVVFNLPQMDILFRDIPIFLMAVVLFLDAWKKDRRSPSPTSAVEI